MHDCNFCVTTVFAFIVPTIGVSFSHSGELVAAGDESGNIYIFDARTGDQVTVIEDHQGADMWSVCFNKDDTEVLTATSR